MKDKIDRIKEEIKELEPFINEQLFQLLANGHTKEQAKKLVLDEIKQYNFVKDIRPVAKLNRVKELSFLL